MTRAETLVDWLTFEYDIPWSVAHMVASEGLIVYISLDSKRVLRLINYGAAS